MFQPGTLVVATIVGVAILGLVVVLATTGGANGRLAPSPLVGHVAPPLTGENVAPGRAVEPMYDLDLHRGEWVVVNFFATWCTGCIREQPALVEFSERHAQAGDASVVSVVFDDARSAVVDFFRESRSMWPVIDDDSAIVDWAVTRVPESFVVDPSGRVVERIAGEVDAAGLDEVLSMAQGDGIEGP